MTVAAYQTQLLALLPLGAAWPRDDNTPIAQLFGGLAEEFARVDAMLDDIAAESLPSQVTQLINEWEAEYGLPDNGNTVATTLQARRTELIQKYQQYGSQSREFLIAMAAALGFDVAITEYQETTFGGEFGGDFVGLDWAFTAQIDIAELNRATDSINRLEQMLRRLIHAHKVVLSNRTETNYLSVGGTLIYYGGKPVAVSRNSTNPVEINNV
ncbi:putative phage tail protein [Oceanobacter kriegii]|uniref:putative phage tail protein n=1 Tax=Oceanobacter kriegii TaxID=64972 RepID=UPI00041F5D92|nr:putative phage tail protein [Oceanobacter kriegii]